MPVGRKVLHCRRVDLGDCRFGICQHYFLGLGSEHGTPSCGGTRRRLRNEVCSRWRLHTTSSMSSRDGRCPVATACNPPAVVIHGHGAHGCRRRGRRI